MKIIQSIRHGLNWCKTKLVRLWQSPATADEQLPLLAQHNAIPKAFAINVLNYTSSIAISAGTVGFIADLFARTKLCQPENFDTCHAEILTNVLYLSTGVAWLDF